jgi:hypothetical protein
MAERVYLGLQLAVEAERHFVARQVALRWRPEAHYLSLLRDAAEVQQREEELPQSAALEPAALAL